MTREAFENAIVIMMAVGGSTNGVLHLLALAKEANVNLSIHDFNKVLLILLLSSSLLR